MDSADVLPLPPAQLPQLTFANSFSSFNLESPQSLEHESPVYQPSRISSTESFDTDEYRDRSLYTSRYFDWINRRLDFRGIFLKNLFEPYMLPSYQDLQLYGMPAEYGGFVPIGFEFPQQFGGEIEGRRPKLSLASLIGQAILAQPEQRARLSAIYEYVTKEYPEYYKLNEGGWQVC